MKVEYNAQWLVDNADEFDEWFNADKFNWYHGGGLLIGYCSDHFEKWFNADKFNWKDYGWYLPLNFIKYIDIWYDSKYFDKSYDELLIESIK
tara:strand:- start:1325 stop:1600 length:276 start_codon:yes stop_codon:yes gene_type:complete